MNETKNTLISATVIVFILAIGGFVSAATGVDVVIGIFAAIAIVAGFTVNHALRRN